MKTTSTLIFTFLFFQISGQSVDTIRLKSTFFRLQQEDNEVNQRNYFNLFPTSFDDFIQTFGFNSGIDVGPLYHNSYDYVLRFFALNKIPVSKQIKKWIDISIGGKWEADAVNHFLYNLRPRILKDIDITYNILKTKSDKEIESFFYFFFSGIHPPYERIPDNFCKIKINDTEFYTLIVKGYKLAIKDSGH